MICFNVTVKQPRPVHLMGAGKAKDDVPRNLGNLPPEAAFRWDSDRGKCTECTADPFADHPPFFCSEDLNCVMFGSFLKNPLFLISHNFLVFLGPIHQLALWMALGVVTPDQCGNPRTFLTSNFYRMWMFCSYQGNFPMNWGMTRSSAQIAAWLPAASWAKSACWTALLGQ